MCVLLNADADGIIYLRLVVKYFDATYFLDRKLP